MAQKFQPDSSFTSPVVTEFISTFNWLSIIEIHPWVSELTEDDSKIA